MHWQQYRIPSNRIADYCIAHFEFSTIWIFLQIYQFLQFLHAIIRKSSSVRRILRVVTGSQRKNLHIFLHCCILDKESRTLRGRTGSMDISSVLNVRYCVLAVHECIRMCAYPALANSQRSRVNRFTLNI